MNAREELEAAERWLAFQHDNLSFGLKCAEHALKLWRYAHQHPELPEFAIDWEPAHRIRAIDYDPLDGLITKRNPLLGYAR